MMNDTTYSVSQLREIADTFTDTELMFIISRRIRQDSKFVLAVSAMNAIGGVGYDRGHDSGYAEGANKAWDAAQLMVDAAVGNVVQPSKAAADAAGIDLEGFSTNEHMALLAEVQPDGVGGHY